MAVRKPPENVLELPLHVRVELAMIAAFERAAEEHARLGLPMSTMREGKVVTVSAEELLEMARHKTPKK